MRTRRSRPADPALADLANGCEACFEASGSVGGMNTCLRSAAPGGTVVHVGFLGEEEVAYPVNTMVIRKEVTVCGSLRAYQEFPLAARLVESGRLDLSPDHRFLSAGKGGRGHSSPPATRPDP